jgi:hypothetical protein
MATAAVRVGAIFLVFLRLKKGAHATEKSNPATENSRPPQKLRGNAATTEPLAPSKN